MIAAYVGPLVFLIPIACMVIFVYIEIKTWIEYGRGWISVWNVLDVAAYVNQV